MIDALRQAAIVDFQDQQIIAATADDGKMKALLATGGITVMYSGSSTQVDMINSRRLLRTAVFFVSVGRKMLTDSKRITDDIESIVDVLTSEPMSGAVLVWREDRFAQVQNGVGWHDIIFQATLSTT